MALIVQKYGGTSVGDVDRIKNVASRIKAARDEGHQLVVVVSARSGVTNELIARAKAVNPRPDTREMDMLLAIGEQETIALTAMALHGLDVPALSYTGAQAGIVTDVVHTKAKIKSIVPTALRKELASGKVVIVAGFQGMNEHGEVTTLGRGGSDLTAIALAAALQADKCEIYTDVDGVYTTDPNICPSARKINRISYEEMLELASLGAKVLQIRSVEVAMKYGVPVHVRSSFSDTPGTWVVGEEKSLEDVVVAGVAYDKSEAKVLLQAVSDKPGVVAKIFGGLAEKNISVDMIIQNTSTGDPAKASTDVTFTVPKTDLARVKPLIEDLARQVGAKSTQYDEDIVKVSIVGLGMRSHAGTAARMFEILSRESINIQAISTSEIKISCLIASKYTELAVRALHDGFGLDKATQGANPTDL
jgi:aspartate kinase